ncbi:MAG: GcrA cell cycle regulator [Fulvimarina manganoxydans]|uniref:GcrA family cell cycle regulator n=1 Tax=Fulvimarina manganoxydans TaxID=937218 RepID=UPI00235227DC|nr:GcrA family cell cycle regulator [Fulvimarina manganoxydans]MCK5932295.1 GcrA cell cycle regulator [Fulvimarina manganoxydans]
MSWTDERVDLLKQLWSEGLSASQIADRLGGVSRNAVIGKVHRLKLESRGKTSVIDAKSVETPVEVEAETEERVEKTPEPRLETVEETVEMVVPARLVSSGGGMPRAMPRTMGATALKMEPGDDVDFEADIEEVQETRPSGEVVPIARKLSLVQLTERTCKWPVGDPLHDDFHFCGNTAPDASPYCSFHAKLAFQTVERRRIR